MLKQAPLHNHSILTKHRLKTKISVENHNCIGYLEILT